MATTTIPDRPVSGLAITSLVLGILTLLSFYVPLLPLALGVLALVFGIVAIKRFADCTVGTAGTEPNKCETRLFDHFSLL